MTVDGRTFELFTDGEHAFSFDADDEAMIDAMKRGSTHDRARHLDPRHLLARHLLAERLHRRLRGDAWLPVPSEPTAHEAARGRRPPEPDRAGSCRAAKRCLAELGEPERQAAPARAPAVPLALPSRCRLVRGDDHAAARPARHGSATAFSVARPEIVAEQRSADGTRKWLLRFADGQEVETRLHPRGRPGCLVRLDPGRLHAHLQRSATPAPCRWCATWARAEIVAQMLVARDALAEWPTGREGRLFTNIVVMGMGEPLLQLRRTRWPRCAWPWTSTGSTCRGGGSPSRPRASCRGSSSWARTSASGLAISLHAVRDELRDELVPINRKWNIATLLDACRRYPARRPITFEYVMLQGVNDSDADARELVRLLRRHPGQGEPDPVQRLARRALRLLVEQPHPRLRRRSSRRRATPRRCARRAAATSWPPAASSRPRASAAATAWPTAA